MARSILGNHNELDLPEIRHQPEMHRGGEGYDNHQIGTHLGSSPAESPGGRSGATHRAARGLPCPSVGGEML